MAFSPVSVQELQSLYRSPSPSPPQATPRRKTAWKLWDKPQPIPISMDDDFPSLGSAPALIKKEKRKRQPSPELSYHKALHAKRGSHSAEATKLLGDFAEANIVQIIADMQGHRMPLHWWETIKSVLRKDDNACEDILVFTKGIVEEEKLVRENQEYLKRLMDEDDDEIKEQDIYAGEEIDSELAEFEGMGGLEISLELGFCHGFGVEFWGKHKKMPLDKIDE